MQKGVVKFFNNSKGYGFIAPEGGDKDVDQYQDCQDHDYGDHGWEVVPKEMMIRRMEVNDEDHDGEHADDDGRTDDADPVIAMSTIMARMVPLRRMARFFCAHRGTMMTLIMREKKKEREREREMMMAMMGKLGIRMSK